MELHVWVKFRHDSMLCKTVKRGISPVFLLFCITQWFHSLRCEPSYFEWFDEKRQNSHFRKNYAKYFLENTTTTTILVSWKYKKPEDTCGFTGGFRFQLYSLWSLPYIITTVKKLEQVRFCTIEEPFHIKRLWKTLFSLLLLGIHLDQLGFPVFNGLSYSSG